eukprot:m.110098 g.110098  ORF g.110098 m.110098 type:complete len:310 (-) comp28010_c0_seq1:238-1167(-)
MSSRSFFLMKLAIIVHVVCIVPSCVCTRNINFRDEPIVRPLNISGWTNKRVLFITAHPDDAEGFGGGLVATLQRQGNVEVSYLIITSGNAGGRCYNSSNPDEFYDCEKEEIAFLRRQESLRAARFLGVTNVWRLGLDDGMSVAYHETQVRRAIAAYVRQFQPHIVITHSPNADFNAPPTCNGLCTPPHNWDDLGYHPDHQHVGLLAFNSLYGSGSSVDNNKLFEDLNLGAHLPEWKIEELYFFALTRSTITHYLTFDAPLLQTKVNASLLHKSQYQNMVTDAFGTFEWVAQRVGDVVNSTYAEGYQGWF